MKKVENYLDEAISNIRSDRSLALTLLTDILEKIELPESHKSLGQVAAKYLETLQRSNEQLVKITALMQKSTASGAKLTDEDKNEIYSLIEHNLEGEA
tara:strand:- start:126 stop:419 length:294 start_codon:yes stop_codon:yes gene_type:complete